MSMQEQSDGFPDSPKVRAADHHTTPARKIRCRMSSLPRRNPCPNEALDDYGLCLKHLRGASEHWASLVASAAEQFPALRPLLKGQTS